MHSLWLRLDGEGPRFRQLYRALRAAIVDGTLAPGARLPATRALAGELGVSRTTVLLAFEHLAAEGYLAGRHGSGSYVQAAPAPRRTTLARGANQPAPRLSAYGAALAAAQRRPLFSGYSSERPALPYDFRYGAPSMVDFPLRAWQRCLGRRARRAAPRAYDYGHRQGSPALRAALAGYLRRARGIACEPDEMLIVNGSQQALDLAARVLLDRGDRAVVEEPGFEGARNALRAAGAELVFAPVDGEGFDPAVLARGGRAARLAYATPSHQYPLGGVMPYGRRVALLDWAARADAWVIEDDYDSEFRFAGRPLEALKALDEQRRVLYVATCSKVMFPALRIGYAVLPPALVEPFTRAKAIADGGSPVLEQDALADFIAGGDFERHLRRSRSRLGARRAVLLAALERELGDAVEVAGANAGMHLVVWLRDVPATRIGALARAAAEVGVGIYSVSPFYATPPARAGLLLGYAALDERDIRLGVERLARLIAHRRWGDGSPA
ncbi:PLP-dependent aminotransferase family protein [bacterium]|nr:PLP-dependent aminotransferase family protein [bacterium]